MTGPIRVLIVDDSALVRSALTQSLAHDPEIEVVGSAIDPYVARDKILQLNPDVLTLDIEMPRMDGLTFLKLIMQHRPMPVVILSSLTAAGSAKALEALQSGAVEVLAKPRGALSTFADGCRLAAVIKAAAKAKIGRAKQPAQASPESGPPTLVARSRRADRRFSPRQIILFGASTGGTEALKTVLTELSPNLPGICVVQHIPAYFSLAFANRLNDLCQLEVREAKSGDLVRPGLVLVAPGGRHLLLRWQGSTYEAQLSDGPFVHHQRPAVDALYGAAVKAGAGPHALAVLLTGMGADGAAGLLELRTAGAFTMAQDEETCVVFGMPREAIRLGAAKVVLPLHHIAAQIERYADEVAVRGYGTQALPK